MRKPAAKEGDLIVPNRQHRHFVNRPAPSPPVFNAYPTCQWTLTEQVSQKVRIQGRFAATVDSAGRHPLIPLPPDISFVNPPPGGMEMATVTAGSRKVRFGKKRAARGGDPCRTGNEPNGENSGKVSVPEGSCKVFISD